MIRFQRPEQRSRTCRRPNTVRGQRPRQARSYTLDCDVGHGLPAVLIPLGADQPRIAAAVASVGAARVLEPTELNTADIHAALKWALYDQDAQRAASELASEITATPPAAVVVDHALALAVLA